MNLSRTAVTTDKLRSVLGRSVAWVCAFSAATVLAGEPVYDPFLHADTLAESSDGPVERVAFLARDDFAAEPFGGAGSSDLIGVAYAGDYGPPMRAEGWELLPDGLIYRSYLAGPREPRLALHTFHNESTRLTDEALWEATLGGRGGLVRFGNGDPISPSGWQLDIEGATIVRLNLDEARDVEASDFRFGLPLTWGDQQLAYKFGYYHISSHLGDERIARTGVNDRVNYVRDAILFGASWFPDPRLRVYGEVGYAFFTAGGAEPWEFQFGLEYSCPGPTGFRGTPFFASNAHLREEVDFGGDWTVQAGWLWRGDTGRQLRLGLHYMNGLSTQYQFFNDNEEQLGFGVWYDF